MLSWDFNWKLGQDFGNQRNRWVWCNKEIVHGKAPHAYCSVWWRICDAMGLFHNTLFSICSLKYQEICHNNLVESTIKVKMGDHDSRKRLIDYKIMLLE